MAPDQRWYSVETPSIFREVPLPAEPDDWSDKDKRAYAQLETEAEKHGTSVRASPYRRG
jgi:hypothetical protein